MNSNRTNSAAKPSRSGNIFDTELYRHEAKYIIPRHLVDEIREYIRPFCTPDRHGKGDPPEYVITTLQLDSPSYALHYAKPNEALNRFKLRVRTYGEPGTAPVFLEVKRKIEMTVVKSRAAVPFDCWGKDLIYDKNLKLDFKSEKEFYGFLEFVRLSREIHARPAVLIRYTRESYSGLREHYSRVTFDRNLIYQPAKDWNSWGRGGRWLPMDTTVSQNKGFPFSGVVLELKALNDAPKWMIDLVMDFNLLRTGNCKYSTAVWKESMFRGLPHQPDYSVDMLCT